MPHPNRLYRILLVLLYATGARRAEAARIMVEDTDSQRMVIHIRQGKGAKDRDVPLSPKLLEELRSWLRWKKPCGYLFPSTAGQRGTDQAISDKTVWNARTLTLASEEFLRRFVQHVLPRGFPRIRYFGFLANRRRADMLPLCRALLHQAPPQETPLLAKPSLWKCPHCHGPMLLVERMTAAQLFFAEKKGRHLLDSS